MTDKTKGYLATLIKSCASALIVFLSALLGDKLGNGSAVALGASIGTLVFNS